MKEASFTVGAPVHTVHTNQKAKKCFVVWVP